MKLKSAKTWVIISLIVCLLSMIISSAIQTDFGKVKVDEHG